MEKKYKLYELISMAERGETFEARYNQKVDFWFTSETIKKEKHWSVESIKAEWIVRMKREPRVIWLSTFDDKSLRPKVFKTQKDAALDGKLIKFIEVMDEP